MSSSDVAGDIGFDFVPAAGRGVQTVDVAGEAVLVHHDGARLHLLNGPAALVWSCFDGRSTVAAVVDDLAAGFGLPQHIVAADVFTLLRDLWSGGLLAGSEGDEPEGPGVIDAQPFLDPPSS